MYHWEAANYFLEYFIGPSLPNNIVLYNVFIMQLTTELHVLTLQGHHKAIK